MITSVPLDLAMRACFARVARNMVGVNASNTEIVNRMRRVVDKVASGEPWCVCFVQWCAEECDAIAGDFGLDTKHALAATESTQLLWSMTPVPERSDKPVAGSVAVWRSNANADQGHCGIVLAVSGAEVLTVEGNTSATGGSSDAERNGHGVWTKRRVNGQIPGFALLGYILPW